jgi:hypothetical protein
MSPSAMLFAVGLRVTRRTSQPEFSSSGHNAWPTKPFAPVTSTRGGKWVLAGGFSRAEGSILDDLRERALISSQRHSAALSFALNAHFATVLSFLIFHE